MTKKNQKIKTITIIPLITALLLAGCVSVPHLKENKIESINDLPTNKTNYSLKENFQFQSNRWWESLNNQNFNNLIIFILKNNKDVQIAQLNLEKSNEQIKLAKSDEHPTVDLNGNFESQKIDVLNNPSSSLGSSINHSYANIGQLGLSATYNFDLYHKYSALVNQKNTQKVGLELKEKYTELTLSTQTLKLYVYYQYLQEEKANLVLQKNNLTQLKNLELSNIKIGKDIPEKSINFEQALRNNENDLQVNQQNQDITLSSLYLLANIHNDEDKKQLNQIVSNQDKMILSQEMFVPESIASDTIKNRPDVAYYLTAIDAQKDQLTSLKADFYPSFSINGKYSLEYINLKDFLSATALLGTITPSFTLPILDSGKITANYKIAGVDLKIFTEQYNQAVLKAYYDVNQSLIKEKSQKTTLDIQARSLKDDKTLLNNVVSRKNIGKASELDYQNQYNSYLKSELDYKKQEFNFATSQVDLINSLGGIYK
jgi:outer membrane protein, multidrug efflux system